jgi:hypothetical protein
MWSPAVIVGFNMVNGSCKSSATPRRNSAYRNAKVMLHLDKLIAAGRVVNQKKKKAA